MTCGGNLSYPAVMIVEEHFEFSPSILHQYNSKKFTFWSSGSSHALLSTAKLIIINHSVVNWHLADLAKLGSALQGLHATQEA